MSTFRMTEADARARKQALREEKEILVIEASGRDAHYMTREEMDSIRKRISQIKRELAAIGPVSDDDYRPIF